MIIHANTDRFVNEVINNNEYAFLFKRLVVIDVGCNIGTFSFWIHKFAKKTYAIDISEENIENMNKTIEENQLLNIKTYQLGIAGTNGLRGLEHAGGDPGHGGWRLGGPSGNIPTKTLRAFMEDEKIEYADLLKVDVEGAEEEIIHGDFPSERINTIVAEVHLYDNERLRLYNRLGELGYRVEDLGGYFLARKK